MSTATALITKHLDTWSSAIKAKSSAGRGRSKRRKFYGIKKARELILELAVRGLLVPQNSNEKTAIECLRTSNPGVLRIDKTLEHPAPSGWVSLPLGCIIASNLGGGTPSRSNPSYWGGDIPWASVKDIQADKYIDSTIDSITAAGVKNSSANLIPPNRLLIVTRMGLGKLAINKRAMAINQDLRAIEPISALDLNYGYLLFKGLNLVGSGMTVKGVKVKELHAIQVFLPPLAEQHRIVAKVDELMALCDQLEQQEGDSALTHDTLVKTLLIALTTAGKHGQFAQIWQRIEANFDILFTTESSIDLLKQCILRLAVIGKLVTQDSNDEPAIALLGQIAAHKAALAKDGNLRGSTAVKPMTDEEAEFELPLNWCWVRFGKIMVNRDGERIPVSKEERENKEKSYDYYGASGVIDKIDGYLFDKPLLLIGEDGANLINRSTPIAFIARGKYWVNNHAHVLDGISEEFLRFIELHINAIDLKKYVTGSAQPKMNQAKMNSIPIALPPLAEQHRIVAKVDELIAICDRLKAGFQTAQATQLNLADSLVEAVIH